MLYTLEASRGILKAHRQHFLYSIVNLFFLILLCSCALVCTSAIHMYKKHCGYYLCRKPPACCVTFVVTNDHNSVCPGNSIVGKLILLDGVADSPQSLWQMLEMEPELETQVFKLLKGGLQTFCYFPPLPSFLFRSCWKVPLWQIRTFLPVEILQGTK